jgi:glutamate synthase (NADPH/NADH) small chain
VFIIKDHIPSYIPRRNQKRYMDIPPNDCNQLDDRERVNLPFYGLDLRAARERIRDFQEIILPFDTNRAKFEASRCIHCPAPAGCVTACPVHNNIPAIMCLIEKGEFVEAASTFRQTSTLPEICGRVCPQEVLCQGSCVHNLRSEPVLIGALEVFVTNYERQIFGQLPLPSVSKRVEKVAIIGGGPSGLACAERLIQRGFQVTVFDARPIPGGLLMYGIPGFKLSSKVFLTKLKELQNAGIEFINSTNFGIDKSIQDLFSTGFCAVYISVGAGVDTIMDIEGQNLPGVFKGTEFLIRANVDLNLLPPGMTSRPIIGKKIVVIGGGDTASDCLRTAIRLGAEDVSCIYRRTENEMPGVPKDRKLARQEGIHYTFLTQPIRFLAGNNGKLSLIECMKMRLGEPDEKGRRTPLIVEGSNFMVEADTAILALGYHPYPTIGNSITGLNTHKGGLIVTDPETCSTSLPRVFAGGDAVNGPQLVVTAIADGQRAAIAISNYLDGEIQ